MNKGTFTPSVSSHKLDPIAMLRKNLTAAALCHCVERVEDLAEALVSRVVLGLGLGDPNLYVPVSRIVQCEKLT